MGNHFPFLFSQIIGFSIKSYFCYPAHKKSLGWLTGAYMRREEEIGEGGRSERWVGRGWDIKDGRI